MGKKVILYYNRSSFLWWVLEETNYFWIHEVEDSKTAQRENALNPGEHRYNKAIL